MVNLSGLNLLRNDPERAAELISAAEQGDMDAQYAAGLIYAEGRGVPEDLVQSYYWLSRAIEQGDHDAEKLRVFVASGMSETEFEEARRLVKLAPRTTAGDGNAVRH